LGPDVVLLDLQMPEMSGVEVLDHLRRDRPTLRVVILTGNEDVEVARATRRAGAFKGSSGRVPREAGEAPAHRRRR
jgi:two-component system, NtrC family, response regulator AtoC